MVEEVDCCTNLLVSSGIVTVLHFVPMPRLSSVVNTALYLALGVTTIRTTGSMEPYTDLEIKKAVDAGKIPGPKINVSGPYM